MRPDYIKIYSDIINNNFPEKRHLLKHFVHKDFLKTIDVIKINQMIFGESKKSKSRNAKHKSYDEKSIEEILKYQKRNKYSNVYIANMYNISSNTLTAWKKKYSVK
jgi:DNA-binding transcriptional regulator YiaG